MPDKDKIFSINTSIDPEQVLNRAWTVQRAKEDYQNKYNEYLEQHPLPKMAGVGYNPYLGTQYNPEVQRQQAAHLYAQQESGYNAEDPTAPYKQADEKFAKFSGEVLGASLFAPELATYGLLGGGARIAGGMAGSWLNSKVGRMAGKAADSVLGTHFIEPVLETAGAFGGWGKGSKLANFKWVTHRPIPSTFKQIERFQNPLKAITSGRTYQAPQTTIKSAFPQMAYTVDYGYASPTATRGNLKELDNFIENDVFPRLKKAGHNVEYKTTRMPIIRQYDPNNILDQVVKTDNADAWFYNVNNTATFRDKPDKLDYSLMAHEIAGHGIRYNINPKYNPMSVPMSEAFWKYVKSHNEDPTHLRIEDYNGASELFTPVEESTLYNSYEPFFRYGDAEGKINDFGAVNTQFRSKISQMNGYKVGDALDPIIDNTSDAKMLRLLLDQPYTRKGTTQILKDVTGFPYLGTLGESELTNISNRYPEIQRMMKRIRDTMKYVGAAAPIGLGAAAINKEE